MSSGIPQSFMAKSGPNTYYRKWAGMWISSVDSWPNYVPTGVPRKDLRDMHIIQGVPLSVALETSQVLISSPDCHSPRPARAAQSVPVTHPC